MDRYNLTHTYDALNRLTKTTGDRGYVTHTYQYDSLGNLVFEKNGNGAKKGNEYWYNNLNQQVKKLVDTKDAYIYSYDKRGNLAACAYEKSNGRSYVSELYVYDATNRMVKGINEAGEESHYVYDGFGYLIANEWKIEKNNYGYNGIDTQPSELVYGVAAYDRHGSGSAYTTGGTTNGSAPTLQHKYAIVHKDYVLDYASPLKTSSWNTRAAQAACRTGTLTGLRKTAQSSTASKTAQAVSRRASHTQAEQRQS
jgi:YD repeat-containing protein